MPTPLMTIPSEMGSSIWAMEPRALEALWPRWQAALARDGQVRPGEASLAAEAAASTWRPVRAKTIGTTAVIPISGVLLKTVPDWAKYYFDAEELTGYDEIRRDLAAAAADAATENILLHISSPGGQVAGGMEIGEAIAAAGRVKNVYAYIEDMGTSAAYWLASQAQRIGANATALVGSIGVYLVTVDSSALAAGMGIKVILIRSGELKGMGVPGAAISEEQIAAEQELIDGLADHFIAAVAAGRGMSEMAVRPLATGRCWLAAAARENGLIDTIGTLALDGGGQDITNYFSLENLTMSETKTQATDAGAQAAAAAEEARRNERQRMGDLKAAFPEDESFALEQFMAGASVAEAKAAYCSVLQGKLTAAAGKITELEKKAAAPAPAAAATGAAPVASEAPGAATAESGDFLAQAKQKARDEKITMTAAMGQLARENPDLHATWLANQPMVRKTRRAS